MKATCNGLWDCYDGSDEPDVCKKSSSGMTSKENLCTIKNDLLKTINWNVFRDEYLNWKIYNLILWLKKQHFGQLWSRTNLDVFTDEYLNC